MKTYYVEINDEPAFVEANSKNEALVILANDYGFEREEFEIYHEVDEDYAEMMGYDTY